MVFVLSYLLAVVIFVAFEAPLARWNDLEKVEVPATRIEEEKTEETETSAEKNDKPEIFADKKHD